jgi:hypothetical protein
VRRLGAIRTLRAPAALGLPASGVAGYGAHAGQTYAMLTADAADLQYASAAPAGPRIAEANARIAAFEAIGKRASVSFAGHVPIEFQLLDARCEAWLDGHRLARGADGQYRIARTAADGIELRCP